MQAQQFSNSLFIDNVKSNHLYVVWQTNDSNNTSLWMGARVQSTAGAYGVAKAIYKQLSFSNVGMCY